MDADAPTELVPPPTAAKRIAALVVLLLLGGLGAALATTLSTSLGEQEALEAQRRESAASAGRAAEVTVVSPVPAQSAPVVILTGTLEPVQAADLAFEVPGRVARVDVELGQRVEPRDVLAALGRASVGAQSAQSSAAIGVAEANAAMARDRVALLEPLVRAGSMAERELTTSRQQLAITEAQLAQARAGLRQVAASSASHLLRAPFAGIVTRVPSGVGVPASPGVPLARVEDLSSLRLRTTVSESELEQLRVGMAATLDGSTSVGQLAAVVRSLDAQTRRAPVEVDIPNPDGVLVANALVRARVSIGEPRRVLRIPAPSRRPDGTVYLVGPDSRVEARVVLAEADSDGSWLVTDGLSADDRVVLRPALVRPNAVVTPVLESPSEAPASAQALAP